MHIPTLVLVVIVVVYAQVAVIAANSNFYLFLEGLYCPFCYFFYFALTQSGQFGICPNKEGGALVQVDITIQVKSARIIFRS